MNNEELTRRLQELDAAFDHCLARGSLPDTIPADDLLGGVLAQTIEDNPQLASQDPLWIEILKEELMRFCKTMLQLFAPIDQAREQEREMITAFGDGSLEQKRAMWNKVYQSIKCGYKPHEVNIDGYIRQMAGHDPEPVLAALVKDWERASAERAMRMKALIVKRNLRAWEHAVKEHGITDYKERKRIERIVFSYPELKEIVRIMGREQPKRYDELDETVQRYLPLLPSPPRPAAEASEVTTGNQLRYMLPVESTLMADKDTEDLFYLKFATQKLQLFANRPKEESRLKTEQRKRPEPRLEKGPIIVSIDTSGSMMGKPEKLAKCLLMQLLRMAKSQHRKCFLITFAVRARCLDISQPGGWHEVNKFLEETFTGGTDGEQMLNQAIKTLKSKNFAMADVLIISDFYFEPPCTLTLNRMHEEQGKGTRFYGLQIDSASHAYDRVLDKLWKVKAR